MSGPEWLRWLLTGPFLGVSAYCVVRLVRAGRDYPGCARAVDLAHVLMGVGMAVMVSPVGGPLPHAGWETVFLLLAVWFAGAWLLARGTPVPDWHGSTLHHALGAAAMFYLMVASRNEHMDMGAAWSSNHSIGSVAVPVVGWLLAGYLLVHAGRIAWVALPRPGTRRTGACQVVMALGTVAMLAPTFT
ncbi:DUF5134 domain-containing protein [Labedaea rhizosphaerae]|uniref:Uncharacterized protein DUF5134 n=1 Tax=Labedaea rhizosphaerae TaxID=598644 RepID=A0A4R6SPQ8_LABRH|nr:DUF5134 domain-containing protein [Labedaea rhizosphaerae]TDQ05482.1 uncharacterized protein DUF5134 [Labedaea rhizosphaerae]